MTNQEFANNNDLFQKACELCNENGNQIKPTKRQASKFRNKKGIVYGYKRMAKIALQSKA